MNKFAVTFRDCVEGNELYFIFRENVEHLFVAIVRYLP